MIDALNNSDGDHLGETNLKKLPEALENPIAIIDSSTRPGRLVALVEISNSEGKDIAAIEIDGKGRANGRIIDANVVVSAYTKRNAIKKLLKEAVNSERQGNGGIYYWQKEKAIQLMNKYGVQFPTLNIKDGFIKSIAHPLSKVNKKINSHTETKQFIKWFGDWKNKPKNASKIVDNKGNPMIVYHQTGNKFNVFDTNKQGAGEFDDETPNGIFLKPLPNDIGLKRATKP